MEWHVQRLQDKGETVHVRKQLPTSGVKDEQGQE